MLFGAARPGIRDIGETPSTKADKRSATVRRWRGAGWIGLALLCGSPPAFGEPGPRRGPETSDFRVQWYRAQDGPVAQDWEIEVETFRSGRPTYVTRRTAGRDAACWSLEVPETEPALVRVRELIGSRFSPWSEYTVVPEPGARAALPSALALLAGLSARRRSRRVASRISATPASSAKAPARARSSRGKS